MIRKARDSEDAKMRTFLVLIRSVASTHHLAAVTRVRSVRPFRPSLSQQSDVSRLVGPADGRLCVGWGYAIKKVSGRVGAFIPNPE